jgi:transposase
LRNCVGPFRTKARESDIGVVPLDDSALPYTAARIRALLEHFNWELCDHPPYSPDLAPSDYHLFTYMKKWLRLQLFNNNEEFIEGFKAWFSQAAYRNVFPDTNALIQAMIALRSRLSIYVFLHIIIFSRCLFVNSSPEVTFRIALGIKKCVVHFILYRFVTLFYVYNTESKMYKNTYFDGYFAGWGVEI